MDCAESIVNIVTGAHPGATLGDNLLSSVVLFGISAYDKVNKAPFSHGRIFPPYNGEDVKFPDSKKGVSLIRPLMCLQI